MQPVWKTLLWAKSLTEIGQGGKTAYTVFDFMIGLITLVWWLRAGLKPGPYTEVTQRVENMGKKDFIQRTEGPLGAAESWKFRSSAWTWAESSVGTGSSPT